MGQISTFISGLAVVHLHIQFLTPLHHLTRNLHPLKQDTFLYWGFKRTQVNLIPNGAAESAKQTPVAAHYLSVNPKKYLETFLSVSQKV